MTQDRRRFLFALTAASGALTLAGPQSAWAAGEDPDNLNIFISPCGQPFRAAITAPYPVIDWFKKTDTNGDGKIDHGEFLADAAAFFKVLDLDGDGVLSSYEVAVYEHRVAPEILGMTFRAAALHGRRVPGHPGALIWQAQYNPANSMSNLPTYGGAGAPQDVPAPDPSTKPLHLDESKQGASPFSFFDEPEPVATADFDFNGKITKSNFLRLADMHFTTLDRNGDGYLTLAKLPKTSVQEQMERKYRRRR
jgi:hypothetical protein